MRAALEAHPKDSLPMGLQRFPFGSCGDGALLMGSLLIDAGLPAFHYVLGERGAHDRKTWRTHAWIARRGLIVDITADQFADAPRGVIVGANSAWHRSFRTELRGVADLRHHTGGGIEELLKLYEALRGSILRP